MRRTAVYTLRTGVVLVAAALGGSLAAGSVSGGAHATPIAATAPVSAAAAPAAAGSAVASLYRSFGGVSCVGRSFCMGVGPSSIQFPLRRAPAFSQVWNGKAWRAPVGVPSAGGNLLSVSCATRKNCVAVGGNGQVSDAWNGRRWRRLPAPAGSGQSYLNAVACPAVRQCVAVGTAGGSPPGYGQAVWAQLWDGTGWNDLTPVTPAGSVTAVFKAISCPGPANCTAVGYYSTAGSSSALAETWNGSSWTMLPAPPGLISLNAISCPDAAECVVVGTVAGRLPLGSAVWNGGSWTSLTTPAPVLKPRLRRLVSVSCASPAYCVAVGVGAGPFAELWTGGAGWKLLSVPDPATIRLAPGGWLSPGYVLSAVDCSGTAHCIAVGGASEGSLSSYASFAVSWNGSAWRVLRTGKVDALMGVSCSSVRYCLTTGTWLGLADQTQILAERWNGKTTRVVSRHGMYGVLSAVSCVTSSFCMAAGQGRDIDRWNGKRWTRSSTGPPPGPRYQVHITGISCASRHMCVALGGLLYGKPESTEVWNGRKWQVKAFASPGYNPDYLVRGVSCLRPAFCLAVGNWIEGVGGPAKGGTLAEVWNGSRWRVVKSPSGGQDISFNTVSCLTRTDCMVIGSEGPRIGKPVRLIADKWNGRSWRLTRLPGTYGREMWTGSVRGPSDISCATAASCMAVGSHGPGAEVDVALSWNGHTWRRVKVTGPRGLSAVSCPAPCECLAIGTLGIRTLAKAWNGHTWRVVKTMNP